MNILKWVHKWTRFLQFHPFRWNVMAAHFFYSRITLVRISKSKVQISITTKSHLSEITSFSSNLPKKFVCGGYKMVSKTESSLFFLHLGGLLLRKWVRLESLILIPTFIYFKNHCIKISVLFIEQKSLCLKMDDNKPIS